MVAPWLRAMAGWLPGVLRSCWKVCSSTFTSACPGIKALGQFVIGGLMAAQALGIHAPLRKRLFDGLILPF